MTISYRYAQRKKRAREMKFLVILLLLCFSALLVLMNLLEKAALNAENRTDASRIIADECKKAVIRGGDRDDLSALSGILILQLGKPYEYGSAGPDAFDCSGLVQYVYHELGIELPRVVHLQALSGIPVRKSALKFGDIVFFSGDGISLTHAGLYVGDGYFVHAPTTGETVTLSRLYTGYYSEVYKSAVRILT